MPGYRTHLLAGAALAAGLIYLLASFTNLAPIMPSTSLEWLGCALFGALFPDIDIKSKIQIKLTSLLILVLTVLVILKKYKLALILALVSLFPVLAKHRTIFHSPVFILFLASLVAISTAIYQPVLLTRVILDLLFFVIGAFSHIYLDMGLKRFIKI
ncbi:MAG TPA: metal-dependent hydrolase [Candidatus Babeliales bacterium]|nr:metal-dependent hydrolase [Candidatus Babeliales bacterium]